MKNLNWALIVSIAASVWMLFVTLYSILTLQPAPVAIPVGMALSASVAITIYLFNNTKQQ